MEFTVKSGNQKNSTACLVLGVYESATDRSAEQFDVAVGGYLGNLLRRGDLEGKPGQSLLLFNVPEALCERVLLVGCGRGAMDDRRFQQIMTHVATALNETGATEAVVYLTDLAVGGRDLNWKIARWSEVVEGRNTGSTSSGNPPRRSLRKIILSVPGRRELAGGEQAVIGGRDQRWRQADQDLGNLPANQAPNLSGRTGSDTGARFPALGSRCWKRPTWNGWAWARCWR